MDGYKRDGHSKYSLKAHIIFITKYRKRLLKSRVMAEAVKQFLYDAAKKYGYAIIRMETDKDHVHKLPQTASDATNTRSASNAENASWS